MVGSYNGPYIVDNYDGYPPPTSSSLYSNGGSYNSTSNYIEQPQTSSFEYIDSSHQMYDEYDMNGRRRFPSNQSSPPLDVIYDGFLFQQQHQQQNQGIY